MRKTLRSLLFIVVSVIVYFLLRNIFPKNRGILTFFLFCLTFDLYLWGWVKNEIRNLAGLLKRLLSGLFWFPVALLGVMVVYGFFYSFLDWNLYIKTYGISLFLCFFFCTFFPIVALFLTDSIRLIRWIFNRLLRRHRARISAIPRAGFLVWTGWALGGVFFFLLLAGMIFWQYDFRIRKEVITLPNLPGSFDGMRIVQFSDVHLGNWPRKDKLEEVVRLINNCKPDMIFFTGDMFNYCTAEGIPFLPILGQLHAPFGIFAILGNHDYGEYIRWPSEADKKANMEALGQFYHQLGWTLLRNDNQIIARGSDSIAVVGVENWGKTKRFQRLGDIEKALTGSENLPVHLLLSHDPTYWESVISKNYPMVDITFSGHTHGGQVGINAAGIHWSPVAWFSKFWGGLYRKEGSPVIQYLYVDEGIGCIGYSGRVGILPEITLFTIRKSATLKPVRDP